MTAPNQSSNVTIRRANLNDRASIDSIRTRSIQGLATSHYTPEQVASWSTHKNLETYPIETAYMIVALVAEKTAGFGELHLQTREVRAVYVDAEYARQGVGSAILRHLENIARENSLADLHLAASLNAVKFYASHGYAVTQPNCKMTVNGIESLYSAMTKNLK